MALADNFATLAHLANMHASAKLYFRDDTVNWLGLANAAAATATGVTASKAQDAINGAIDGAALFLSDGLKIAVEETITEIARGYGVIAADVDSMLVGIREAMSANSHTITRREVTRDTTPEAFSTTTTLKLYRNTTRANGKAIEVGRCSTYRVEVTGVGGAGGTRGSEALLIRGDDSGVPDEDFLRLGDISRLQTPSRVVNSQRDSLLQNSSFENGTGQDGSTSAISGWTPTAGALGTNIQRLSAAAAHATTDGAPARNVLNGTTGRALRLTAATCTLSQKLSVRGINITNTRRPVFCGAWVKPTTGTAFQGTFQLTLGSESVTLAHGAMAAGWNLVIIPFTEKSYYAEWAQSDPAVTVGLSAYTQGSLDVDEVMLIEMTDEFVHDGMYWVVPAAPVVDPVIGDFAELADSTADTGQMQTMICELYGRDLHHVDTSPTYAEYADL